MERRIGFVGVIIENRHRSASSVNEILSRFGDRILGRMGLPYPRSDCGVIVLIVEMNTDELGDFTGRLGRLPGVTVKSALGPRRSASTPTPASKGESL